MSQVNLERISNFCERHNIYMETKLDSGTYMYAFYFEKNRQAFTKLVGCERVNGETSADNFADEMIATLRRKYKIPEEGGKNVRR